MKSADPHAATQSGANVHPAQARTRRGRPEADIQAAIFAAVGLFPDVKAFRNNCGVATFHGHKVRYGLLPGSSDIVGIGPGGRFFSWEVKTEDGRLTEEQERWLRMVRKQGGFAAVLRSVDDALRAVERMRAGASE